MQLNRITQKQLQNEWEEEREGIHPNVTCAPWTLGNISLHHQNLTQLNFITVTAVPRALHFFRWQHCLLGIQVPNRVLGVDVYLNWNRLSSSLCSETPTLRPKGHFQCAQHLEKHIMNSNKFMALKRRLLFLKFHSLHRINHLGFVWIPFKRAYCALSLMRS